VPVNGRPLPMAQRFESDKAAGAAGADPAASLREAALMLASPCDVENPGGKAVTVGPVGQRSRL
jgi:hypothetical protein